MIINGILVALNAKLLRGGNAKAPSRKIALMYHMLMLPPGLRGPLRSMYSEILGFYRT
jgi:hypothetical protein